MDYARTFDKDIPRVKVGRMKNDLLADSIVYSSSRYLLLGLSLLRNFVVAKLLGPEEYGHWIIVMLILTYGDQLHLGLRHAGDKEIPFLRGGNRTSEAIEVANTIFGGTLIFSMVAVVVAGGYVLFSNLGSPLLKSGVLVACFIVVSDQVNRFYLMILRANKQFVISSKIEALFEIVRTFLICLLVWLLRFDGALVALLTASLATTAYFVVKERWNYFPQVTPARLKRLVGTGMPLFISGLLYLWMMSWDRVIGSTVLSKEALGHYGLGSLIIQLPISAILAVSMVLYPRFSESFGESGTLEPAAPLFFRSMEIATYLSPPLVAAVLFSSEFLIQWLLPGFAGAVKIIQWLSNGMYFMVLVPLPMFLMMATGRYREYISDQIATVVIAFAAYVVSSLFWEGSEAIAKAAATSYFVFLLLILARTFTVLKTKSRQMLYEMTRLFVPGFYSILVVWVILSLTNGNPDHTLVQSLSMAVVRIGAFLLLYSPVLIAAHRRTNIFASVKELLFPGHDDDL